MSRKARLDVPGALHHIMARGINKAFVFKDDEDKARFLERLGKLIIEDECAVYAWVIMDNHVHLLFRSGKNGVSAVMRKLFTWYAQYHNRKHKRSGHLFQNRYKSVLCDQETYLLALVRYIHLNPVRAKIIKTIEELDHYPWSGHKTIIGKTKQPWMDTDTVLSEFGETRRKAIAEYRKFILDGWQEKKNGRLTGGGLLRSHGGWSQVLAMRRKGQKEEADERILGSGEFVHAVLQEAEDRQLRQLKVRRGGLTIEKIMREESRKAGISEAELKGGGRRTTVSRVRAEVARRCREELGHTSAEIARHLGVATSSIARAIARAAESR